VIDVNSYVLVEAVGIYLFSLYGSTLNYVYMIIIIIVRKPFDLSLVVQTCGSWRE